MTKIAKNTVCLWYERDAEEAARFYARTFPDSSVGAVHRAPGDFPSGKQGDVLTVEFTVMGIPCLGLNGGPSSSTTNRSHSRLPRRSGRDRSYWNAIVGTAARKRVRLVQRQVGRLLADTPIALIERIPARSRRRQAGVRCNDDDEKNRHRL